MELLDSINKDKLLIIDGNSLAFRAYYALPPLANFDGVVSNAVFGFCNMLIKAITEIKPKYIAVAFDYGKKTFRNDLYEDYKGNRHETPADLKLQFPILKDVLKSMNISTIEIKGFEADDIIGSLTKLYDVQNIILTGDRDSLQLINDNTLVMLTKKGISETKLYNKDLLKEDFLVEPYQIVELKSIMGDASDNIPGVKGIGEKGAISLLEKYKTLDGVYNNIDEIKGKMKEYLIEQKDMAYLSKKLATIDCDVKINVDLDSLTYDFPFNENVMEYFKKYQFNSLIKRKELFNENAYEITLEQNKNQNIVVENIDSIEKLKVTVDILLKETEVAIFIGDILSLSANNVEYNVSFGQDLFTSNLDYVQVLDVIEPLLLDKKINKVVFDYKSLLYKLHNYKKTINQVNFDILLGRYLINPNSKINVGLKDVSNEFMLDETKYASNILIIYKLMIEKIKELNLLDLYYNIELPLVNVLFNMEIQGVKLDVDELDKLDKKYEFEINELTNKIYALAGKKFNINSPKQLAEVLYGDLKLKAFNNKKNSTKVEVLMELIDEHEIVPAIIKYRQVYKLYTTYIKAYKDLINKNNHKIYTMFNQFVTTTGRLSSSEPNLQNIPVRSEEGANIRSIFISSFEDGYIVSADYSQIELRLLAHLSDDENLIKAYRIGEDIHAITASEIFNIPLHEVTSEMRRAAKAINFGIVYGISDYGLSQNINTSVQTANKYISKYFEKYPNVKKYMESNVAFAKQNGYVKSMYGRIRPLPEINSSNYNIRTFNERAAMNMPLQGSASDIIKLAMIKVEKELKNNNLESKLILQVHDELIVDTKKEELEIVKTILKTCMESVAELKVPLVVNVGVGKNWKDAK